MPKPKPHDAPDYRSIKLTKRAFEALHALRDTLYAQGMDALPADLRPHSAPKVVSLSLIVEVGVQATEQALQKKAVRK